MSNSEKILYGAYGANRDPEMLQAITGNTGLVGRLATFKGVELCVQRFDQISDVVVPTAPVALSPKAIMVDSWGENSTFETYTIRPNEGGKVAGQVFELTAQERALIAEWEMIEFGWYKKMDITAVLEDGSEIQVNTEGLGDNQEVDRVVNGTDYPTYLNDPTDMFKVAEQAREDFLARQN